MRYRRVSREIPRRAAARVTLPPVWRRASTRCTRSTLPSASASAGDSGAFGWARASAAADAAGMAGSPSSVALTTGASERSATRSITFASSRTFPGHG